MKTAVFPGTFDPMTNGHVDIVQKALPLFDKVIIALGDNAAKKTLFPLEQRMGWIRDIFKNNAKVEVTSYSGLTVNFCTQVKAQFIVRGLRSSSDFEYEEHIAQVNRELNPAVDTIFVLSSQENAHISSTIVRDLITHHGNYQKFIPKEIVVESN